ncbi:SAM-dependent methyltransferase [Actinomadura hibisca]|uniref:SAM-dependent methyltransferase n=1 Tax=Actinomadura hibisca TaxID=68565 RepID=UPI000A01A95F|nr:SAM-dependent methyltransferase [Actinomadura hibisca]
MTTPEQAPPGVDPAVPSVARMYDYYLGGKDNFAADREAAEKVIAISREVGNDLRGAARANRAFLGRAVRSLAARGCRQFLDVGAGLPTQENVHQVVLREVPDAQVVYVDNDPTVLVHARALLADNPQTSVVEGDLLDPEAIRAHRVVRERIDFDRPVTVILCAILQFVPDDEVAASIVARLCADLAPGSHLVLSHPFPGEGQDGPLSQVDGIYKRSAAGSFTLRSRDRLATLLGDAEPVPPGLAPVEVWEPGADLTPDFRVPTYLGVVARVR